MAFARAAAKKLCKKCIISHFLSAKTVVYRRAQLVGKEGECRSKLEVTRQLKNVRNKKLTVASILCCTVYQKIFGNGKASVIISEHLAYSAHPSLWCLI